MEKETTKEILFHFKMSLDWEMKAVTYLLVLGVGIGIPSVLGILYAKVFENPFFLFLPIPFACIFFATWLLSPKAISLSKETLFIERPLGSIKIALAEIGSFEKIDSLGKTAGFVLRLWGSGGAWGSFGWFWSRKWGVFKMHTTNKNFVLLKLKNGKKILISPDKQNNFLKKLEKLIKN